MQLRSGYAVTALAAVSLLFAGRAAAQAPATASAPLADSSARAVVLYFVATDCPISNRSFAEMKRVRQEFATRHIAFWYVYPNQGETTAGVTDHQRQYDPGAPFRMDREGKLVALAVARVTPEVAILVPQGADSSQPANSSQPAWRPVYVGRIDDRYVRLGLERPAAREHYAEQAINAILHGGPIPQHTGTPVGCGIMNPAAPESRSAMAMP